jgi:1,5-anhydro-D-fructose reductase (1,5-anhydro-D-mannitol-forming)
MIKVGIIGYGKMGKIRHHALHESGLAEVVAVSEPRTPDGNLPNLTHEEIIGSGNIDAVFICTPNYLNQNLTLRSLAAGKHVFCEKPPAFNAEEVRAVIEAEARSGKKLMYGFNHRHHDSIRKMKEIIDSDVYGKILWIRGRYGKSVTKDYYHEWRAKKEYAGGGIVIDQGIHMIDLCLYLAGDFDKVTAEVSNLYWHLDVEDNAFIILKNTATGCVASLHSTMTQWRHLFSLEIFLERGYMVLNGLITSSRSYGDEVLSIAKNRSTAPAATWEDEEHIRYQADNSWRSEIGHFLDAVIHGRPVGIGNSRDALQVMRVIDKIYSQA